MTGIDWLDWLGVVLFGLLAAVAAARLTLGWRSLADRTEVVQHGVMAAGMAAMSAPGGHVLSPAAGVVTFAVAGGWALQALVRRVGPWRGLDRSGTGGPWWRRSGGAAHHLMASLVMVVGFGGGHVAHASANDATVGTTAPSAAHDMDNMDHDMHDMDTESATMASTTSAHDAHQDQLPAVVNDTIETTLRWPIWPLAGTAFVVYALWIASGRADRSRCGCTTRSGTGSDKQTTLLSRLRQLVLAPRLERGCAVVMASGMGVMTYAF